MMKLSRFLLVTTLLTPALSFAMTDDEIDARNITMLNMLVGHVTDGGTASINGRTYVSVKGKLVPKRLIESSASQQGDE